MQELQFVISNALNIFKQNELYLMTREQLKLLENDNIQLAQEIYMKYLHKKNYKRKDTLLEALSLILTWRAYYKYSNIR